MFKHEFVYINLEEVKYTPYKFILYALKMDLQQYYAVFVQAAFR
jgi:hypothetical protein